jgi:hypothetical protein
MDSILFQNDALISDYDAGQFGGDLGSEEIDNTWEGVPNLVIDDWSLNIGRFFLNLCGFQSPHRGMRSRTGLGSRYD